MLFLSYSRLKNLWSGLQPASSDYWVLCGAWCGPMTLPGSHPLPHVLAHVVYSRLEGGIDYIKIQRGTSLVVQWVRLQAPKAGGLCSIPGRGTRSCMPQLRSHEVHLRSGAAQFKKMQRADAGEIQKRACLFSSSHRAWPVITWVCGCVRVCVRAEGVEDKPLLYTVSQR